MTLLRLAFALLVAHIPLSVASQQTELDRLNQSIESLVQRVGPSVVQILVSGYAPQSGLVRSTGDLVIQQRSRRCASDSPRSKPTTRSSSRSNGTAASSTSPSSSQKKGEVEYSTSPLLFPLYSRSRSSVLSPTQSPIGPPGSGSSNSPPYLPYLPYPLWFRAIVSGNRLPQRIQPLPMSRMTQLPQRFFFDLSDPLLGQSDVLPDRLERLRVVIDQSVMFAQDQRLSLL